MSHDKIKQELHELIDNLDIEKLKLKDTNFKTFEQLYEVIISLLNLSQKPKEKTPINDLIEKLVADGFEHDELGDKVWRRKRLTGVDGIVFKVFTKTNFQLEIVIDYDTKQVILTNRLFRSQPETSTIIYSLNKNSITEILTGIDFLQGMQKNAMNNESNSNQQTVLSALVYQMRL